MVQLTVLGPRGPQEVVEAMLDTGFNGELKLPKSTIDSLGLAYDGNASVMLADGNVIHMTRYLGWVLREGEPLEVLILESPGVALAGTALLWGSRLTLDLVPDGAVRVEAIGSV